MTKRNSLKTSSVFELVICHIVSEKRAEIRIVDDGYPHEKKKQYKLQSDK